MSEWADSDWSHRGALANGLYAMQEAGLRAVDALQQLKATTDYITEHYRDDEDNPQP